MRRSSLRRLASVILSAAIFVGLIAVGAPALAQECGCTGTGEFIGPAVRLPAAQELSPGGGTYRLRVSQNTTEVTLRVEDASTGAPVKTIWMPLIRAVWGFSPDGQRFMYRHATDTHIDQVHVWDLAGGELVYVGTANSGAAFAFSPHGRYFYINILRGPSLAELTVKDSVSGATVLYTEIGFESAPGDPGDVRGVLGMGFSSEAADRTFLYAYRSPGGTIVVHVENLESGETATTEYLNVISAWWRFSPCGDAFGVITQPGQNSAEVRMVKTANGEDIGTTKYFSPLPAKMVMETTATNHRVLTTDAAGLVRSTNVGPNEAGNECPAPPALGTFALAPESVVGGSRNATGTVRLTRPVTEPMVVNLTSSNTAAATVPASVTIAAGEQSKTFGVTTKPVPTPQTVTITAVAGGITKMAVLSVGAKPPGPEVSQLDVKPLRIMGGSSATGNVTINVPAGSGGSVVALTSTAPAAASVPVSVTVPAGASTATFSINTVEVLGDTPAVITASGGGVERTKAITVLTANRQCTPGVADQATQSMSGRAFAAYGDNDTDAYCSAMPRLENNGILVKAGSTGLQPGDPVEIVFAMRSHGAVHTSPPIGHAGRAGAWGLVKYSISDDDVDAGEADFRVIDFTSSHEIDQSPLYPDFPDADNTEWTSHSILDSSVGDRQETHEESSARSEAFEAHSFDTGALTARFATAVGHHLTIRGILLASASAYEVGSSAVVDLQGGFTSSMVPAPGFEGLDIRLDSERPANHPPVCRDARGSTDEDAPWVVTPCTDQDGDVLTYEIVTAPAHGMLSAAGPNGAFTYTPAENYSGPDSFSLVAADSDHSSDIGTVSIDVNPVNDTPTCVAGAGETVRDTAMPGTVECSDADGDTLAYTVVMRPDHGTVPAIAADGTFTYTPAARFTGSDSFVFEADDGRGGTARNEYGITVQGPPNLAPTCTAAQFTTAEDTALNGTVRCSDPDGNPVAITVVAAPQHGTVSVIAAGGGFTYAPAANYAGDDSITVKASDGIAESPPVVLAITVTRVNDAPECSAGSGQTTQGTALTARIACTDADGDVLPLSYKLTVAPKHGKVSTIAADGGFTYTPKKNFVGNDAFRVMVSDGKGGSVETEYRVTVVPAAFTPPANRNECRDNGWQVFVNPSFASETECRDYVKP